MVTAAVTNPSWKLWPRPPTLRILYPHGLYWFIQSGTTPAPAVIKIIEQVKANGSPAAIIEIGGFDELMEDLFLPHQEQMPDVREFGQIPPPAQETS